MLTFGSTSSATRNLPFNMQATLEELFANLTLQRASSEVERRRDDAAVNASATSPSARRSEGERPSPGTIPSDTFEGHSSPDGSECSSTNQCGASASEAMECGAGFAGGDEGDVEQYQKATTESSVMSIVRQLQEILQEDGPTPEDYLMEALGPAQARVILEEYGTLAAFLDRRPGFRVLHQDLYTFMCYEDPEEYDEQCDRSSLVKGEATAASFKESSKMYYNSGRRRASLCHGERRPARSSSSSSSSSYESALDTEGEGDERRGSPVKDGFLQVFSRPRQSRAWQGAKSTRDVGVQVTTWDRDSIAKLEYTLEKRKAEIKELQEALRDLQLFQALELQELRSSVSKLLKRAAPPRPWCVTATAKMRSVVTEKNATAGGAACRQDSPFPWPWSLLPERCPAFRPRPDYHQRGPAIDPMLPPLFMGERRSKRSLKRSLVPEFQDLPCRAPRPRPGPTVDKKCRRSAKQPPFPGFPEIPNRHLRSQPPPSVDKKPRGSHKRPAVLELPEPRGRERRPQRGSSVDNNFRRSAKQSTEPEFPGHPGRQAHAASPCPESESVQSGHGGRPTKSRVEQHMWATECRVTKDHTNQTDAQNRGQADASRRPRDALTKMNINAIVALMLGHSESTSHTKP